MRMYRIEFKKSRLTTDIMTIAAEDLPAAICKCGKNPSVLLSITEIARESED